jgi:diguanylate cyclase (GGDEF)-like protein
MARVAWWSRASAIAMGLVGILLLALLVVNKTVFEANLRSAIEETRLLRLSHEAMLNQQTGLRGFLLSQDDRFLEAYDKGRTDLETLNPQVSRFVDIGGREGELMLELRLTQQDWIQQWATEALRAGRTPDGVTTAFLEQEKALFDTYRVAYDELVSLLAADRDRALDLQATAISWSAGLTLAFAVLMFVLLILRGRGLRQAVGPPFEEILRRLDRIKGGDFASFPPFHGPSEFETLAIGLDETASALREASAAAISGEAATIRSGHLAEILRFGQEVNGSLSLRFILGGLCTAAARITHGATVRVWLGNDRDDKFYQVADSEIPDGDVIGIDPIKTGYGVVGSSARFGRMEVSDPDPERTSAPGTVAIPMVVGGQVIGVIEVRTRQWPLSMPTLEALGLLALQAATAIDAAQLHTEAEQLANTDPLTRLANRRQFDADLRVEVSAGLRYGRPLGLLMADIDHFKAYNDSFGHPAADAVLKKVARIMSATGRASDRAYRYGGEEFVFMLRESTVNLATQFAERLSRAVEHAFSAPGEPRGVTISVGVAGFPDHGTTSEALITAADAAMYEAKRAGRNRVVEASTLLVTVVDSSETNR